MLDSQTFPLFLAAALLVADRHFSKVPISEVGAWQQHLPCAEP